MTRRLLALVLLAACGAEPDPLDPGEIDDVAKGEGDADGDARSGTYLIAATSTRACDCAEVQGIDLCDADLTQIGDGSLVTLMQTDGYLLLSPASAPGLLSLTGSLDADGSFDLGGLYDLSSVVGEGDLVTRLTGEFAGADRFTALLRTRVSGTLDGEPVDCRTEVDVTGERQTSPP